MRFRAAFYMSSNGLKKWYVEDSAMPDTQPPSLKMILVPSAGNQEDWMRLIAAAMNVSYTIPNVSLELTKPVERQPTEQWD